VQSADENDAIDVESHDVKFSNAARKCINGSLFGLIENQPCSPLLRQSNLL
jgi:hypothetical protein